MLRINKLTAALATAGLVMCLPSLALAQQKPTTELAPVQVIGTTPLPGVGLSKEEFPGNVQTATGADLQRSGALNLPDFMNRNLGSVHINETQGNPYQPDVSYRGYTASPLLGTPQGLSVYMDGVRLNQPFGDVVSWDLIPHSAISSIALMPGSNPLFGLNTLGGALAIQTKDGLANPGSTVQASIGSYRRGTLDFTHGGASKSGWNWFVAGSSFKEDGWRESSPSRVNQLFTKLGWKDSKTDLKLTTSIADSQLYGNGLQDFRRLETNYASIYTKPDITENQSLLLNLVGQHEISDKWLASGNVYYRKLNTTTFNGDVNDGSLDQSLYQPNAADRAALAAAGYTGVPTSGATAANTPFPYWRCIAQGLQNDEPGEKCTGLLNRTSTRQENYGAAGQLTFLGDVWGKSNQLVAGAGYDASRSRYRKSTQLGYITSDHSITGINAFGDGLSGGNVNGDPYDQRVDLSGQTQTWSVFASDTITLHDIWHVTASGRYNYSTIRNTDNLFPYYNTTRGSLTGQNTFIRFNPALGFTVTPSKALNAYLGYSESSRAPTSIELGCADPNSACKLPNAMAGDPPLKQVVAKTWEAGLRGSWSANSNWNAGVFRTDNYDDIMFIAGATAGAGYFKNFGQTRRQGAELGINTVQQKLTLGGNYTYLDATYQTQEVFAASGNSSNTSGQGYEGNITVNKGNRLPLIPRHLLKVFANYQVTPAFSLGMDVVGVGGAYVRGNENNQDQATGNLYLGSGKLGGYAVVNFSSNYTAANKLQFFMNVSNLFDRRYNTAGQLGTAAFDANGNVNAARSFGGPNAAGDFAKQSTTLYAPGAPRMISLGIRYEFGKGAEK